MTQPPSMASILARGERWPGTLAHPLHYFLVQGGGQRRGRLAAVGLNSLAAAFDEAVAAGAEPEVGLRLQALKGSKIAVEQASE